MGGGVRVSGTDGWERGPVVRMTEGVTRGPLLALDPAAHSSQQACRSLMASLPPLQCTDQVGDGQLAKPDLGGAQCFGLATALVEQVFVSFDDQQGRRQVVDSPEGAPHGGGAGAEESRGQSVVLVGRVAGNDDAGVA